MHAPPQESTSWHVKWSARTLPGPVAVPVRIYRPGPDPFKGWLVWAHGGSWRHGSAAAWHPVIHTLAALSRWAVVSVDYRLVPHHRHPHALLDVLAALEWIGGRAQGLPVAVGGDSAGGTLAAAAALAARDRGLGLDAQVLAYPPMDPACAAPSYHADPTAFPQASVLRGAWADWRAGDPSPVAGDGVRLYSTPLDCGDLSGVAPAVLAVGELDPVRDDVTAYARRLRDSGVTARLFRAARTGHGDLLNPGSTLLRRLAAELATVDLHPQPAGVPGAGRATVPGRTSVTPSASKEES